MKNARTALARGTLSFLALLPCVLRAQEAPPGPIAYGSPESFAEFHGFVSLEYINLRGGAKTFDLHEFYFNAIAKIRKNVTILAEIEYEHGGEEIRLDRAFLDWQLAGRGLNLRLGKFYAPFGIEIREYQAPVRRLVSRPLMASALLFNEWSEVGVNVYGDVGDRVRLEYDVAVVNGPGATDGDGDGIPDLIEDGEEARQNRDNNSNPTVIGRLSARFPGGLATGFSYAEGRYSDAGAPKLDFSLVGLDARFTKKGLDLRGEWARRAVDLVAPARKIRSSGYYVQGAYRHVVKGRGVEYIEAVVRYDHLDPGDAVRDDETERVALGLNYSPYPHMVVRSEYQFNRESPTKRNDGVLLHVVVDF